MISNGNSQQLKHNSNGHQLPTQLPLSPDWLQKPEEDWLNFSQMLAGVRRRWWLLAAVSLTVSSVVWAEVLSQNPSYEGKFRLLVETIAADQKFEQLGITPARNGNAQDLGLDPETQIQVMESFEVMSPILNKIQAEYPNVNYSSLVNNFKISHQEGTKIFEVRYHDSSPQKVKFILDRVAHGYIHYSQIKQQTSQQQGLQFVGEQLPKLQNRVDRLQEKLQIFRQQYNLVNPESQGQLLSNNLSTLVQQRQATKAQIDENLSLSKRLQSHLGLEQDRAIAASELSEAPRYQELLKKLQEIDTKIAAESARFTESSPSILALREQRNQLLPLLHQQAAAVLESKFDRFKDDHQALGSKDSIHIDVTRKLMEINDQMQVLEKRYSAIALFENQTRSSLQQLAVLTHKYTDLQRELQVATESLNRFLTVRETLQIESAQKAIPWQMITPAQTSSVPISPNVPRGLLQGALAGLLAGVGAVLIAEKLDNRFHSPNQVKDSTGLTLLGTIPFQKELERQQESRSLHPLHSAFDQYQAFPFLEAFRSLCANLRFLSPDKPVHSLVITSSVTREGKSTTSVYLAQAAAAMGQRVLLVDADLRRPRIHTLMNLSNEWGLSHVIATDLNIKKVIQRSPLQDNLYVLTAGKVPPDPTQLLCSIKMKNLVEQLQESFDLIIFDTPPVLAGLADAKLLAAHTNGIVLLARLGQTEKSGLRQVLEDLKMSHGSVLGLIVNGVKNYPYRAYSHYYQSHYPAEESLHHLSDSSKYNGSE